MLLEDLDKALRGLLEPEFKDVVIGHTQVRAVFRIAKLGKVAWLPCHRRNGHA